MTPIQILLIIALSFCILLFFVRMKHTWVLAIIVTCSYIFGITIIIKPSITQVIAGYMGVGRGVDLIFYLRFVFFMILHLLLYSRYKSLKQIVTDLAREITLMKAKQPDQK